MTDQIYVILIDGRPYCRNNAIRTYKTPERAVKEAQNIAWWNSGNRMYVAKFNAEVVTEVEVSVE